MIESATNLNLLTIKQIRKYLNNEYYSKFTNIIIKCKAIQKDPMFRWCAHVRYYSIIYLLQIDDYIF
jgi:hypothetical protein